MANKEANKSISESDSLHNLKVDKWAKYFLYDHLKMENKRLQKQIEEMTSFLNEYGLVWIGNKQKDDLPV
jgi:hypothetical protein